VHRDVKPANILLEMGVDRVMLTDFGLARAIDDASITRTGLIAGTPQYMSPEQARGEALDARSDLFSLGSVLYTMATGRPPFRAESTYGILRRITDSHPRPVLEVSPHIPAWLSAIVDKLLAKEPAQRFATAAEVALLLEQCVAHVQQPAVVALPDFCRRRSRWTKVIVGRSTKIVGLIVIVCSGAWWLLSRSHQASPPDTQQTTAESQVVPSGNFELQWDSVAESIEQLQQDGADLESRTNVLWDRQPIPAAVVPAPATNLSPAKELTP
jgi:serine/threonine-protein kinase